MKNLLISILMLIAFKMSAQSVDTLKSLNNTPQFTEQTTAYYDKLDGKVIISFVHENNSYKVELFDITGISVLSIEIYTTEKSLEIPVWLKPGIYILIIRNGLSNTTRKFRVS